MLCARELGLLTFSALVGGAMLWGILEQALVAAPWDLGPWGTSSLGASVSHL